MWQKETYDLPPPALSGSGSKGTSQLCSAPGDATVSCFGSHRQMHLGQKTKKRVKTKMGLVISH